MIDIDREVSEFISAHFSENSQRNYSRAFARYRVFNPEPIPTHRADDVIAWYRRLKAEKPKLSDATISLYIACVRSVFGYLVDMGYIAANPFKRARRAISTRQRAQVRPTAYIYDHQVRKILSAPNATTREGVRDRALLAILFGGGLRRSELLGLNVSDCLYDDDGNVTLQLWTTKAGKYQEQPLPRWASARVIDLLKQRLEDGVSVPALLVNYRGYKRNNGRLSIRTVARLFVRYCRHAGVKAAPHAARATGATNLHKLGYSEIHIQEFLRHSTTQQVAIYIKRHHARTKNAALDLNYFSSE